jgi:Flp pilus assembly pilin Flp
MTWLIRWVSRFNRDQRGASIGEYALLLSLVAIIVYVAMAAFGAKINDFLSSFSSTI